MPSASALIILFNGTTEDDKLMAIILIVMGIGGWLFGRFVSWILAGRFLTASARTSVQALDWF